jgi:hypothetical protein
MTKRKLPIGIQDFEKLRRGGYIYVDKTAHIYRLVTEGNPYFLSRPRRFGKSLLVSTLKAYFEGKKELFEYLAPQGNVAGQESLAIAGLEKEWKPYPVLHLDLTGESYQSMDNLESGLEANLKLLEAAWGKDAAEKTPAARLRGIIHRAYEKTGSRVVVLIDEYDKPLTDTLGNPELHGKIREALQGFYSVLKAADQWLRFVFLTGVTKFSKVSIFSTLNQLRDISMEKAYAGICGITQSELTQYFNPEIEAMAMQMKKADSGIVAELQKRYNGYHFAKGEGSTLSEGVYNPFSLLNTFAKLEFSYYWFQTGTPTFLIDLLKRTNYDLRDLDGGIAVDQQTIEDYRPESPDPAPLFYQTGYLTLKAYKTRYNQFILGFPNEEVKYGFLKALLPEYAPRVRNEKGLLISNFIDDLEAGDLEAFMIRVRAFFTNIPYDLYDDTERCYQSFLYVLFTLMGEYVQAELRSSAGRADLVVSTETTVFCFEFKLAREGAGQSAEDALAQIDDKNYLVPYSASGRALVKVGAVFDSASRTLGEWKKG